MEIKHNFKVWKTVTIGTGEFKSKEEVITHLFNNKLLGTSNLGHKLDTREMQEDPLGAFAKRFIQFADEERLVNLVRVTGKELGVKTRYCEFGDILKQAKKMGLKLCHPEVVYRLRMEYRGQLREDENYETFVATPPFEYKHCIMLIEAENWPSSSDPIFNTCYLLYGGHEDYEYSWFTSFVFEI